VNPSQLSLIQTGGFSFDLNFIDSTLDQLYFEKGLIFHMEDSQAINSSSINLSQVTFTNYNPWTFTKTDTEVSEGYLFLTEKKIFRSVYYFSKLFF